MQEELNLTHEENQSLKDANEKLWVEVKQVKRERDAAAEKLTREATEAALTAERGERDGTH